jgi:hypothetical protein
VPFPPYSRSPYPAFPRSTTQSPPFSPNRCLRQPCTLSPVGRRVRPRWRRCLLLLGNMGTLQDPQLRRRLYGYRVRVNGERWLRLSRMYRGTKMRGRSEVSSFNYKKNLLLNSHVPRRSDEYHQSGCQDFLIEGTLTANFSTGTVFFTSSNISLTAAGVPVPTVSPKLTS